MFQRGDAEEALHHYADAFADAEIGGIRRFGAEGPGAEGSIHTAWLTIAGQRLRLFDSPVAHEFDFTPSLSLFVEFEDEAELERTYERLLDGGEALMALDDHGFSRRFGWVNDRFGVSWQLNLE